MKDKESDIIKLSDFGLSRTVDQASFMKTMCGTPQYVGRFQKKIYSEFFSARDLDQFKDWRIWYGVRRLEFGGYFVHNVCASVCLCLKQI